MRPTRYPARFRRFAVLTVRLHRRQAAAAAGRHKARQQPLLERGSYVPPAAEIESAERAWAEPMRDFERRQHADGARETSGAVCRRGSNKSSRSIGSPILFCAVTPATVPMHSSARIASRSADGGPACRGPEAEEGFTLEFPAEQRADPRAGEANRMTGTAIERKDEGVAEHAANGAGLDLGALGRRAASRASPANTRKARGSRRVS